MGEKERGGNLQGWLNEFGVDMIESKKSMKRGKSARGGSKNRH